MTDQERFEHETQPLKWMAGQYSTRIKSPQLDEEAPEIIDFPEICSRQLAVEAACKEDQLLIEVIQEHLGRLVVTDDFKDCQVTFREGRPNEYVFAHLGVDLGIVRRELELKYGYTDISDPIKNLFSIQHTVTFRPIKPKTT